MPDGMDFQNNFNPHSHAGSDKMVRVDGETIKISIHTPTQGVTCPTRIVTLNRVISIHTPTQGVTDNLLSKLHPSLISIHTPTQGVT